MRRRPVLRYHGGKWRLATWVIEHFPPHRIYVEPFGGAASVLLHKPRTYAEVYNDIDGEVVNVFRVLREPALALQLRAAIELTPFARAEFKLAYEPTDDPVEKARRTIVKSFLGFGSSAIHGRSAGMRTRASTWTVPATGFRKNSDRSGTTPAHDWATWPAGVPDYVERLRGVVIECKDGLEVIRDHDRADALFYVDPPYVRATRSAARKRKAEYRFEMTDAEHEELAEVLHEVKGHVVLSGYHSDLYDRLYQGWVTFSRSSHADGARDRTEVLWLPPRTAEAIEGRLL